MPTLQIRNLNKTFNGQQVLQDVSFAAMTGDVVAVMGKSGSGKSTLLRCINLLVQPDAGTIQVDDQVLQFHAGQKSQLEHKELIALRQKVGIVFQQLHLWEHMTVMENLIEAPIQVLKQKKQPTIEEATSLLEKMGLINKLHHYPNQLSGGQKQRVAILRTLMIKPQIILFDEPTSALDPEMTAEVLQIILQLSLNGSLIVIATHEIEFAKRAANKIIFLDEGKIEEEGSILSVFRQPKSNKFKQFLTTKH